MFDDWIDILLSGSHEIKLPSLTVTGGNTEPMQGSGTISWHADTGIRLQAVTDGGEALKSEVFGPMPMPGTLVPHSTYLKFVGRTRSGWDLVTYPTTRDGCQMHSDRPEVVWDLPIDGITLQYKTTGETNRLLRILMGPLPEGPWTRSTRSEVKNEFFGGNSEHRDWLHSNTSFGQIAARQRSNDWFELRVMPAVGKPMDDPNVICTAVARAFGFILGRRCAIRGLEEINEGTKTRRLDSRHKKSTQNTLLPPLGWQLTYLNNVEQLLGPTIDFFLTKLGERVASFLYLSWDAADNALQTRLAISSICVEGLLRVAAETLGPAQPDVADTDLAEFENWLKGSPAGFSPKFSKRLGGLKSMFTNLGPKDILRDWIERGVLGMTKEDMDAWSDTRNSSVHGRLTTKAESQPALQVRVTSHDRVQNILNRIILQLIGYTGEYIDYSQPGHPTAVFPSVKIRAEKSSPASSAQL